MGFKPPKGTTDFLPEDMVLREYVINKIKDVFIAYGFECLETPIFEDWDLLTKKCGEEIKKQIFRFKDKAGRELGLRFDLTVGMARVIANNPQLPKPFKRYYIAPVWRYEEITRGRRRQFYQCDIDIVGTKSMEAEVECISCAIDCLKKLGFENINVIINNRKILEGMLELLKVEKEKKLDVFRAIDKIDKFGGSFVKKELKKIGLENFQVEKIIEILNTEGKIEIGRKIFKGIKVAEEGINELKEIYEISKNYGIEKFLKIDFGLARGLDYYTGPIFEIVVGGEEKIGSVAGGGRYDNLIELLGGKPTPATGISLGIERIIEIIKEGRMIKVPKTNVRVFVANIDSASKEAAIKIAQELRKEEISTQTDLMNRNIKKQLEYCNSLGIPFAVIIGKKEMISGIIKVKDLRRGKEFEVKREEIVNFLKVGINS
ncbi:MAG: histidine--tRNA ligase [Candidatus Aenigmatarchaeota archaeon]